MSQETALANRQDGAMTRIKNYMLSQEVKSRFADMMGTNGIYYLNQVMILVANNYELQKCEPQSILISAMRAASLRLSVDPAQGQAWIIPYNGKATFQLGYKGVYELAMRTREYRFINVLPIFEGETIEENRMTGMHSIAGKPTGKTVIAWMLYFQTRDGFEKTFLMTCEEIEAHAAHYSPGYRNPKSKWHDPVERPKMEKKTVLVNGLRRWGRFNPGDAEMVEQIESDQGWIDRAGELPEEDEVTPPPAEEKKTEAQILHELTGDPAPKQEEAGNAPATIDLETALNICYADGVKLGDKITNDLDKIITTIKTKKQPTPAQQKYLDAIAVIKASREQPAA